MIFIQEDEEESSVELLLEEDASFIHQPFQSMSSQFVQVTRLYLMFLFTWQSFFRVSDVGMNVLCNISHAFDYCIWTSTT